MRERFLDLLLSVYLYNEWRGYTQIEEKLLPELVKANFESQLLSQIKQHGLEEKKHHQLFLDYFKHVGREPFQVGKSIGYFDLLVKVLVGSIDKNFSKSVIEKLFRVILITEKRGIVQVRQLLKWKWIKEDPFLERVFKIIEKDEPGHYGPYQEWLERSGKSFISVRERVSDILVHYSIALFVLPFLYLNPFLKRVHSDQFRNYSFSAILPKW